MSEEVLEYHKSPHGSAVLSYDWPEPIQALGLQQSHDQPFELRNQKRKKGPNEAASHLTF
jgi:hypothetical protein